MRDLGMVFKPSFKCFKNEKIIENEKTKKLLRFRLKQKKTWSGSLKNMPNRKS